jgi:hypothetical protein
VLRAAASIASAYCAQLWIVHVVPTPPAYSDIDLGEHTKQLTEASQYRLRELKAKLGVDAPHSVIDALLADGIHQEVLGRKADLLVTGRGHSIGTFSRLWSHLYSIIRDSPRQRRTLWIRRIPSMRRITSISDLTARWGDGLQGSGLL